MTIEPIALSGNSVSQLWLWIRSNPVASLTAAMVCITAYYARATTRYVKIVSQQFAAQIEPVPIIELGSGSWQGNTFLAPLTITASRNDLVLVGGDILLRCEHGSIRLAMQLHERAGDTLSPGQHLQLDIKLPFEHAADGRHSRSPSLEGFLLYSDSRNVQTYRRVLGDGGITRIYRQRDLERLKTWMSLQRSLGAARLTLWVMNAEIAVLRALSAQQSKAKVNAQRRSSVEPGASDNWHRK